VDCKTAHDLLPLYFDGELDRESSREFEAHLDACADCRAALIELDSLRRSLRDDAPRYAAPALLRKRLQKELSTPPIITRKRSTATRWMALAASWVIAFAAGGTLMTIWSPSNPARENVSAGGETQVSRDLFASHWRALAATSPIDVVSTDRHTVKPWFAGKVSAAPIVQDFAEQGFALIGGRIDYVGNSRVPVLVYRHGQHLIDVFVLPPSEVLSTGQPILSQGYALNRVKLGDQTAAVVSDMDATELSRFAQLLSSAK
jgi:anti-sigma factor RsiW